MPNSPYTVFVVEDNEWYNKYLVHTLSLNPDFLVKSFFSGKELMDAIYKEHPNVITLDYRLPDAEGTELLKRIKEEFQGIEVIVISEQEDIATAVELLKSGAYDYLVKSEDIRDRLLHTVNRLRKNQGLKQEITVLKQEVQEKYDFQKTIIGNSAALRNVYGFISKATQTNITVTITGETGTGKEVVAKAIHFNSNRKDKPFVAINMAALPAELIESELFGYEKGAFTGANTRRIGKFEEANGGTLFLDEIGEMDITFQAKLLRALQEKEITRIGSNDPIKINCRIIVATNRDLQVEVKEGNFREDLYYRLFGLPIHLPPLRDRDKDVLLLAKYFIEAFCKENEMPEKGLSDEAKMKLLRYTWPGNIRELKSIVELGVVMSNGDEIEPSDLTINVNDVLPDLLTIERTMREYNQEIVLHFMKKLDNNTKAVADKLDIGQTTVYRLLKEYQEENEVEED